MQAVPRSRVHFREGPWANVLVVMMGVVMWLVFRHTAPAHDVAWLMEGARRWLDGARLYDDIRELNPPLIFYDMVGLSAGTTSNVVFVAGVAATSVITSLWVGRHHGAFLSVGTFLSLAFAGMVEFGQREHLLLIFVTPYLLAKGSPRERALMGLWAFLGVGLKPYFVLVVALPALLQAWRNWRSLFDAEKLALGGACIAYVVASAVLYPTYFNEILPQARATYSAYGMTQAPILIIFQTLLIGIAVLLADAERKPFAAAVLGALACYYLQGRFWAYHFITAAGLGMVLCFWQQRLALWTALVLTAAFRGPYIRDPGTQIIIPVGISRVAVLSAHVHAAYPAVVGCGVVNETPWGSLGWVPGPWNVVHDSRASAMDRQHALQTLMAERQRLRGYILSTDTQLIIADAAKRKIYFNYPIDFMQFIGPLPGFKLVRKAGRFEYWAKGPLIPRSCEERY